MPDEFKYDVFLSHSAKDKAVVRPIAERLRKDGLLDFSFGFRVSEFGFPPLAACLSAHALGSDWAQLACPAVASQRRRKAGTFRFRDSLNKDRRFVPLRLDASLVRCVLRRASGVERLERAQKD